MQTSSVLHVFYQQPVFFDTFNVFNQNSMKLHTTYSKINRKVKRKPVGMRGAALTIEMRIPGGWLRAKAP